MAFSCITLDSIQFFPIAFSNQLTNEKIVSIPNDDVDDDDDLNGSCFEPQQQQQQQIELIFD